MKRGNLLIALLVLLAAVSIFSTGLYANFLDTFTGNSFSFVTGNMVSITGEAGAPAETDTNQKVKGEHCTANRDCYSYSSPQISNACRGTNNYCYDQLPAANEQPKRGIGRICNLNSQCLSGKCSNGICGKKRGETCANNGQCLSGDCFDRTQCDYSNVNTGNNANDLCSIDTDCKKSEGYRCSSFHRCVTIASLKKTGESCTSNGISYDQKCLSGTCTNDKCAKSADGELCESNPDCSSSVCGADKRCSSGAPSQGNAGNNACNSDSDCPQGKKCKNLYSATPYGSKQEVALLSSKKCIEVLNECPNAWKGCEANQSCFKHAAAHSTKQKCSPDIRKLSELTCSNTKHCAAGESCIAPEFGVGVKYCMKLGCTSSKNCMTPPYDELGKLMGNLKAAVYCKSLGNGRNVCDGKFIKNLKCETDSDCPGIDHKCITVGSSKTCMVPAVPSETPGDDRLNNLKDAINNAINFLSPRIQAVVREHDIPVTGRFTNVEIAAGQNNVGFQQTVLRGRNMPITQNNNAPAATLSLSEWISTIAGMDGRMQSIEDQICAESFRHPEIENDGLPCVRESPIQRSAFSTMFGRLTGRG